MNERDLDVLKHLEVAETIKPGCGGWLTPMWCGGQDASHHSQTLRKLWRNGLVERKRRPGLASVRPPYLYRITGDGLEHLEVCRRLKELME